MLQIAVLGAGSIGQALALRLDRAGHRVTLIARGDRLKQLQRDGVVEKGVAARRNNQITVVGELDVDEPFDVVLLTILHHHFAPLVPVIQASKARQFLTLFNAFDVASLRVDPRIVLGFPSLLAELSSDGQLTAQVPGRWPQPSIANDERLARLLSDAGVPAVVEPNIDAWLKSHAVAIVIIVFALCEAQRDHAGLSLSRARIYGAAALEALDVVRSQGHQVTPRVLGWPNAFVWGLVLFVLSRLVSLRAVVQHALGEADALAARILAAQPDRSRVQTFQSLRAK